MTRPPPSDTSLSTIHIVDDDPSVLDSLCALFESEGYLCQRYTRAGELLAQFAPGQRGCVLLDLNLPLESGLSLLQRAVPDPIDVPVILISGKVALPEAVDAMKQGAITVLEKPLIPETLLSEVARTLDSDYAQWRLRLERRELVAQLHRLTPRERQVLSFVLRGRTSVEVGAALNISYRTVEVHRGRILSKTDSASIAELVYRIMELGLQPDVDAEA